MIFIIELDDAENIIDVDHTLEDYEKAIIFITDKTSDVMKHSQGDLITRNLMVCGLYYFNTDYGTSEYKKFCAVDMVNKNYEETYSYYHNYMYHKTITFYRNNRLEKLGIL